MQQRCEWDILFYNESLCLQVCHVLNLATSDVSKLYIMPFVFHWLYISLSGHYETSLHKRLHSHCQMSLQQQVLAALPLAVYMYGTSTSPYFLQVKYARLLICDSISFQISDETRQIRDSVKQLEQFLLHSLHSMHFHHFTHQSTFKVSLS